ncbi:dnaJ homolog subfamily B member 4-like, partial [Stegodyphus dumicola]|uniref:dnaJ homolog subfamily B member 4-like n=1 Tax=Stegodyphus dumicola TaxID=202533 RepID=UPI0015B01A62
TGFYNVFNNSNNFDTFYGPDFPGFVSNPFFCRSQSTRNRTKKPQQPQQPLKKDPPITHDLYVSLEDVLIGCTKKMKIERNVLNPDRKTHHRETKVLTINVKPGWKAGTKITFKEEGDENPDAIPSDIVFIVKDKVHSIFERDGSNIRYNCNLTLKQALCGAEIEIPTLTGEKIPFTLLEVIRPDSEQRFVGRGLPLTKDNSKRGDLIVTFRIKFPDNLTDTSKKILKECLPS